MVEVIENFYIGNQEDYESNVKYKDGWNIINACKEPYHRKLLGYTSKGAPKNDPEYLIAERNNRLICNLVDTPKPEYIPKEIIDKIIEFIDISLNEDKKVLLHCNLGESRSPSIGLLYLAIKNKIPNENYLKSKEEFLKIYPKFNPQNGIEGFIIQNWRNYIK